jgi:rifampicin phosphotransferase
MTDRIPDIVWFTDPKATDKSLVGGKGANLAVLTQASFPVPAGFCVTTAAYAAFVAGAGLGPELARLIDEFDYDDPERLEKVTSEMRDLITDTDMPAPLADAVGAAYGALGSDRYVAVRSSATAEDLAEASFAGLHDSFLDVQGAGQLLDAVRRCWASMWTARAAIYRHTKGFDHGSVGISVVVQVMVDADVSGVVFTGNPLTTATDEMVINASFGLGESIVQGIVTPDEYTVKHGTLTVVARTLGSKAVRTVRDPQTGTGTVTDTVPDGLRNTFALTDGQIRDLALLARNVQAHYGEWPQDIEWALAGGTLHLLQSRPVTGVEFSWDADVDDWQRTPDDPEIVWTRGFADEVWTGAISPLMYSIRAETWTRYGANHILALLGANGAARDVASTRMWKFHKSEAYYNGRVEHGIMELTPPAFRPARLSYLAPPFHDAALEAPFSPTRYVKAQLGLVLTNGGQGLTGWFKTWFDRIYDQDRIRQADGLPDADVRLLSDRELVRYVEQMIDIEVTYWDEIYLGFLFHIVHAFNALGWMVANWYDGDNPMAALDLMTGSRQRTATQLQNHVLWEIAEEIRASPVLSALMKEHSGRDFFDVLERCEEGRAVAEKYRSFAAQYPHRGHDDRDIAYARRGDDPSVDYQFLQSFLSAVEPVDPAVLEEEANRRREATYDDVVRNIERKALGRLKAEALKLTYEYVHKFIPARDDERDYADRYAYAWRRAFLEMGRRLRDRGLFAEADDVFFLSRGELYRFFDGNIGNHDLTTAKIAARRRDFDRFYNREATLPMYLQRGRPAQFGVVVDPTAGVFQGSPTSRGVTTGTARVVKRLKDIGRLNAGEILVCNGTDPGWTPVFLIIAGIVTETGGINSHASCLSREYGFPSVQLEGAMQLIPDGATISVDGDTGLVRIVEAVPSKASAVGA